VNRRTMGLGLFVVLLVAALALGLSGTRSCGTDIQPSSEETPATVLEGPPSSAPDGAVPDSAVEVALLQVVDGDTIRVRMADGSAEKVRYIGIDAPEIVHSDAAGEYLGDEATAHNSELLASGPLRLETDVDERDDFGRLLAYVWAGEVFINERMVADGYARAHDYPPNLTRQERLWDAHDAAREAGIGIWGEGRP
jgi:micrococcal nuclease